MWYGSSLGLCGLRYGRMVKVHTLHISHPATSPNAVRPGEPSLPVEPLTMKLDNILANVLSDKVVGPQSGEGGELVEIISLTTAPICLFCTWEI
jgi:hypothetical protein